MKALEKDILACVEKLPDWYRAVLFSGLALLMLNQALNVGEILGRMAYRLMH